MTTSASRPVHPQHGTHDPTSGTPARRPGSVRRTTTVDLLRPDGTGGEVLVDARGRDLVTPAGGGEARTAGVSRVRGRVDYPRNAALAEIDTDPALAGVQRLIGTPVASGFRAKVVEAVPVAAGARAIVHLLLDDLPGAVLVSGYAVHAHDGHVDMRHDRTQAEAFAAGRLDLCSGFRRDGTMLVQLSETGIFPMPTGPVAPDLESPADPAGWHEYETLPVGAIRRRRRMDVTREDGFFRVDAMFRDSYVDSGGLELVIHEYTLDAVIDPAELRIETIEAVPRVLPWVECPVAAASAGALAGRTVGDLRPWVRAQLAGTSTCTHLNDLLRSLNDVDGLVPLLR
ncbi:DUF2889 domain-containing protein [Amycolatopsis sp. GM8]|uniref:DUF2889 domain-containing protein n=1 Tax=Amycolatopsis sp. GM8 TaxID=2896530 RepID=UPI001F3B5536|nr:DUF2889 domain-containing protein [Amycolatopsis sp. GM8]